jgi:hypothetical protein
MAYGRTAASPSRRLDHHANPHGDIARPIGIGFILIAMTPLVILPLASIFIYSFGKGLDHFWDALISPPRGLLTKTECDHEQRGDSVQRRVRFDRGLGDEQVRIQG